jgi:hypothetical protein
VAFSEQPSVRDNNDFGGIEEMAAAFTSFNIIHIQFYDQPKNLARSELTTEQKIAYEPLVPLIGPLPNM